MLVTIRKSKVFLIILLLVFLSIQKIYSKEDRELYSQALNAVRHQETVFAFMHFHALLECCPKSKFFEDALFAVGEYYFSISDYYNATDSFLKLINQYPNSGARPFALAYLAEIARKNKKVDLARDLEKEIIRFKSARLLFREFKEHKYISSFSNRYKATYFIDRIEIHINNELFAKIPL